MWCLGPWMNHLPPVWWTNYSFLFLNESWCVSLTQWRGILYWCLFFIIVFIHCPNGTFIIPLIWFHPEVAFLFYVLGTTIFHRRSLYSFLLQGPVHLPCNITTLIISADSQVIESGRYLYERPKTLHANRICHFCNSCEIKDKIHMFLMCLFFSLFHIPSGFAY